MEEPRGVSFAGITVVTAVIMIIPIMVMFRAYQDSSPNHIISLIQKLPEGEKKYIIDNVLKDMADGEEFYNYKIEGDL